MYLYVKGIYEQWCQGQDEATISIRHNDFIKLAARTFALSEEYMSDYLKDTSWFKY